MHSFPQFIIVCIVALSLMSFQVIYATDDKDLQERINRERETIADYRTKLEQHVNELKRLNEERMRKVNEHARQTVDEAQQMRDNAESKANYGRSNSGRFDNVRGNFDDSKVREAKERVEKLRAESRQQRSEAGGVNSILSKHSVDEGLVDEISRMATASIPRDSMIQHVKQHFPNKRPDEWNDIVVAALSSRRQTLDPMDNVRAREIEIENKKKQFDRMKSSFDARHPERSHEL